MQDPFAYCAELVRSADRDRFIAALFAPTDRRGALHALQAFNSEIARVREVAREPLPGEIRLQWWSDVLNGERGGEARANPVAAALLTTIARYRLSAARLQELIEAHRFDLYDEPMGSLADLETYARKTSSALFALSAEILAGVGVEPVTEPAGIAYALAGMLRAFPVQVSRRQLYLPADLLARHQVRPADIFAGRSSPGLAAALRELGQVARERLSAVRSAIQTVPREAVPALLPVALVRPLLDRLARSEPFAPLELPPWRRQWLIWRAARQPSRLAG